MDADGEWLNSKLVISDLYMYYFNLLKGHACLLQLLNTHTLNHIHQGVS